MIGSLLNEAQTTMLYINFIIYGQVSTLSLAALISNNSGKGGGGPVVYLS